MVTTDNELQEIKSMIKDLVKSQAESAALIRENERLLAESQAESDRRIERLFAESRKDADRQINKLREEHEKSERLFQRNMEEYEKRLARQAKMTSGVAESYASFAEEYFYNSFYYGELNFFGEKFDDVQKNRTGPNPGEYDIMLFNCKAVAVIEVKFKIREKYISEVLKKEKTFRLNFPEYSSYKLYLGIAAMVFDPEIEKEFIESGIAVVKQVGDKVVIIDDNLKTF